MIWLLLGVFCSYVLVNSPLIYSLWYGHGIKGTGKLWGYAPNQFLFLVLFFPFAAFASFAALRLLVLKIYSTLPPTSRLSPFIDHWPVVVLVGLIIAALFTILVYFTSAWSFDKLRPQYAQAALKASEEFENEVEQYSTKKEEQEAYRRQLITRAKSELETIGVPAERDPAVVEQWLARLSPGGYLQVVQDKTLPHRLRLLDPAMHVLNLFQTLLVLFIGMCALFVAVACLVYANESGYDGSNLPSLKSTLEAVFWAIFFFSFYVICYHQFRSQIEELVGTKTTILQDIIAGLVITALFLGIRLVDPSNRELSAVTILKLWPILFFASGVAVEETLPQLMRQLIGNETTLGFQVAFSFIFVCLALIPTIRIALRL